jgi:hypothetical protein
MGRIDRRVLPVVPDTFMVLNTPMSDKTKRMRDDAMIAKRFKETAAKTKPKPTFKCQCGNDNRMPGVKIIAVYDGRDQVTFCCLECVPDDVKAMYAIQTH